MLCDSSTIQKIIFNHYNLKISFKNIIKEDNFLSLAGNIVVAFFGIVGFAILARSLSVEDFGQWVLLVAASSFIEMFRFGLTSTGLIRFLSGSDKDLNLQLIGANAFIGIISTISISLILFICNYFYGAGIEKAGYGLFFTWYPVIAFVNLPWNNAIVLLYAERLYGKILFLKAINSVGFAILLALDLFFIDLSLNEIVLGFLSVNFVTSIVSIIKGWDGIFKIKHASLKACKKLLDFGRYTTFTLIGTNLLRSIDTFIISLSPLGNTAVALYSIPLKLTELQQIPLRSFTATAFPKMSKANASGKNEEWKSFFYSYAGAITLLFIPLSICTFIFAEPLIVILAGKNYTIQDPDTGFNAVTILRIFSIYGLLLPIDRMTGIGLDSINRPQTNVLKVFIMVTANVIGDLIAVYLFHSLLMVAVASVLFTLIGIITGMRFLNKYLRLNYKDIFIGGKIFYTSLFAKLTAVKTAV